MADSKHPHEYMKYIREERLPHIFCPGCGNGIVLNTIFKGMELSDKSFDDLNMVSGIGCSSRIPGYVKCDSLHTTHGRAIAFAFAFTNPKNPLTKPAAKHPAKKGFLNLKVTP